MASTTATTLYLFFFFFFFSFFFLPFSSHGNLTFIKNTCNGCFNPDFCVSTLLSDKRSINTTSVAGLAAISLDIVFSAASDALAHVNDLADRNAGEPIEEPLHLCGHIYEAALDDLNDAKEEMQSKSYGPAEDSVGSADGAPGNCEKAFADESMSSPVTEMNKVVEEKCDLCSDLIDLLNS